MKPSGLLPGGEVGRSSQPARGFSAATGSPGSGTARWDGSAWSNLNSGLTPGGGRCLTVWDDGGGAMLYVGGGFSLADGVSGTRSVAAWDGTNWWPTNTGLSNYVNDLAPFNDGLGEGLFATGGFFSDGTFSTLIPYAAKWDGSVWQPLGDGLNSEGRALALFDDNSGAGPRLAVWGTSAPVPVASERRQIEALERRRISGFVELQQRRAGVA